MLFIYLQTDYQYIISYIKIQNKAKTERSHFRFRQACNPILFYRSLLYASAFIRHIFQKIKICIVLMFHPVSTGDSDHRPGKFSVLTIFI